MSQGGGASTAFISVHLYLLGLLTPPWPRQLYAERCSNIFQWGICIVRVHVNSWWWVSDGLVFLGVSCTGWTSSVASSFADLYVGVSALIHSFKPAYTWTQVPTAVSYQTWSLLEVAIKCLWCKNSEQMLCYLILTCQSSETVWLRQFHRPPSSARVKTWATIPFIYHVT